MSGDAPFIINRMVRVQLDYSSQNTYRRGVV